MKSLFRTKSSYQICYHCTENNIRSSLNIFLGNSLFCLFFIIASGCQKSVIVGEYVEDSDNVDSTSDIIQDSISDTDTLDSDKKFDSDTNSLVDTDTSSDTDTGIDNCPGGAFIEATTDVCWYIGEFSQSCEDLCLTYGNYSELTMSYAGSGGSDAQCNTLLETLGAPGETTSSGTCKYSTGCYWDSGDLDTDTANPFSERFRCTGTNTDTDTAIPTSPDAFYQFGRRVCACTIP